MTEEDFDCDFDALEKLLREVKSSGEVSWKTFQEAVRLIEVKLRGRISIQLKSKVRASDLAQSALRSWMSDLTNDRIETDKELAYFYAILGNKLNRSLRHWKSKKRSVDQEVNDAEIDQQVIGSELEISALQAMAVDVEDWIMTALEGFPEPIVTAFLMRFIEGISNKDVLGYLEKTGKPMSLRSLQLSFKEIRETLQARAKADLDRSDTSGE